MKNDSTDVLVRVALEIAKKKLKNKKPSFPCNTPYDKDAHWYDEQIRRDNEKQHEKDLEELGLL